MTEVLTISLSRELKERIDTLRGDVTRSKFICKVLEEATFGQKSGGILT